MTPLEMKKGLTLQLAGMPDMSVIELAEPRTVAVPAMDIPYIRPKLLVKEGDAVKTGTPVFCDKRNKSIQYLSPATGTVKEIRFGPRRRLLEVVIEQVPQEEFVEFGTLSFEDLGKTPRADIVKMLKDGGMWQCFRQFPAKDTADEDHVPAMVIVSMNGNDPFSPHPGIVLDKETENFSYGIALLQQLARKVVVTCRSDSLKRLNGSHEFITHTLPDLFPAWDPGAVLYKLKTSVEENSSWCISAEHLILAASLLRTGRYPVKRVVTVTRAHDKKPHIIARQGAPVSALIGQLQTNGVITTGRFNGRKIEPGSHLGFFENTLGLINCREDEEMFGFLMPGFSKPTASRTFLSRLIPTAKEMDCSIHGEERACINCGYCTRICPVDLHPNFIMKALHSDDIEDALSYGLLDCCRCGLCSFACPSKIELTQILSDGMDAHFKDKE